MIFLANQVPTCRSAYITFQNKEAADKALGFSGASFYSRSIKVIFLCYWQNRFFYMILTASLLPLCLCFQVVCYFLWVIINFSPLVPKRKFWMGNSLGDTLLSLLYTNFRSVCTLLQYLIRIDVYITVE